MKFIDKYDNKEYSMIDLFNDYNIFKKEEPYNHCVNFTSELFEIILASINGRNDLEIIGLTPNELSNYILKLKPIAKDLPF